MSTKHAAASDMARTTSGLMQALPRFEALPAALTTRFTPRVSCCLLSGESIEDLLGGLANAFYDDRLRWDVGTMLHPMAGKNIYARGFHLRGERVESYSVMVPEDSMREGRNEVEVLEVTDDGSLFRLAGS